MVASVIEFAIPIVVLVSLLGFLQLPGRIDKAPNSGNVLKNGKTLQESLRENSRNPLPHSESFLLKKCRMI